MRHALRQLLAIARLTALEILREPICLVLMVSCYGAIAFLPLLITHTMGEGPRLVRDSVLALTFVSGLLLSGYGACAALNHEIRRGTVAAVLSKPVAREVLFVAKYLGVASVILLFLLGALPAILLSERTIAASHQLDPWSGAALPAALAAALLVAGFLNYVLRRPFVSRAAVLLVAFTAAAWFLVGFVDPNGSLVPFGHGVPWSTVPAVALVGLALLVLAALATSLATRLDAVPTLSLCTLVFLLGLISDYAFGRAAGTGNAFASLLYTLVPNWQHFWATDALADEGALPLAYLLHAAAYAWLYLGGVLALGVAAFRHAEVSV